MVEIPYLTDSIHMRSVVLRRCASISSSTAVDRMRCTRMTMKRTCTPDYVGGALSFRKGFLLFNSTTQVQARDIQGALYHTTSIEQNPKEQKLHHICEDSSKKVWYQLPPQSAHRLDAELPCPAVPVSVDLCILQGVRFDLMYVHGCLPR